MPDTKVSPWDLLTTSPPVLKNIVNLKECLAATALL